MAGFQVLLGVDNDSTALRTFAENHNGAKCICAEIDEVSKKDIENKIGGRHIDFIVGGPPCQGLSLSGPRRFSDPRNRLFLSFVRITREIEPKGVVLENVPGSLGLFKGKIKNAIIQEFERIGYRVFPGLLNAADYGVPQTRRRVFFVGLKNKSIQFKFPVQTHSDGKTFWDDQHRYITCEEAIGDLTSLENSLGEEEQDYPSPPKSEYQRTMRSGSKKIINQIGTRHTQQVKKIIALVPEGGNYKDLPQEYRESRNFHVAWTRYHSKKPAPTIDTGHRHHFHYKYNRVPTVRENARIQSFPDRFIFYGNKSDQNKQVGNAVPPLLAKAIATELLKCL